MPRIARKELKSSYFHIIIQGINREYIFKDNYLKKLYKNILKEKLEETDIKILAYCIMDNHAHFLIYCEKIEEMKKLMRKTNTSYAMSYNRIKNRVGYVFRDRYYTQQILTEQQLFNCVAYIHNNPIKASITSEREKYAYSSYREYINKKDLITEESIKLIFGSTHNYIDVFNEIHNERDICDIAETKENKDKEEIIQEFLNKYNVEIEKVIQDNSLFCELLTELRHYGGLSLREMSRIFGINKDKLNKIINQKL